MTSYKKPIGNKMTSSPQNHSVENKRIQTLVFAVRRASKLSKEADDFVVRRLLQAPQTTFIFHSCSRRRNDDYILSSTRYHLHVSPQHDGKSPCCTLVRFYMLLFNEFVFILFLFKCV